MILCHFLKLWVSLFFLFWQLPFFYVLSTFSISHPHLCVSSLLQVLMMSSVYYSGLPAWHFCFIFFLTSSLHVDCAIKLYPDFPSISLIPPNIFFSYSILEMLLVLRIHPLSLFSLFYIRPIDYFIYPFQISLVLW